MGTSARPLLALDMFLVANEYVLSMSNADVYELAKSTVKANMDGISPDALLRDLAEKIGSDSVSIEMLQNEELIARAPGVVQLREKIIAARDVIRLHSFNKSVC